MNATIDRYERNNDVSSDREDSEAAWFAELEADDECDEDPYIAPTKKTNVQERNPRGAVVPARRPTQRHRDGLPVTATRSYEGSMNAESFDDSLSKEHRTGAGVVLPRSTSHDVQHGGSSTRNPRERVKAEQMHQQQRISNSFDDALLSPPATKKKPKAIHLGDEEDEEGGFAMKTAAAAARKNRMMMASSSSSSKPALAAVTTIKKPVAAVSNKNVGKSTKSIKKGQQNHESHNDHSKTNASDSNGTNKENVNAPNNVQQGNKNAKKGPPSKLNNIGAGRKDTNKLNPPASPPKRAFPMERKNSNKTDHVELESVEWNKPHSPIKSSNTPRRHQRTSSFTSPSSSSTSSPTSSLHLSNPRENKLAQKMEKEHVEQLLSMRRVMIDMHLSSEETIQSLEQKLKELQVDYDILQAQQQVQQHEQQQHQKRQMCPESDSEADLKEKQENEWEKDEMKENDSDEEVDIDDSSDDIAGSDKAFDRHRIEELEAQVSQLQESIVRAEEEKEQYEKKTKEMGEAQEKTTQTMAEQQNKIREYQKLIKDNEDHTEHLKSLVASSAASKDGDQKNKMLRDLLKSPSEYHFRIKHLETQIDTMETKHEQKVKDLESTISALEAQQTLNQTCLNDMEEELTKLKEEKEHRSQELAFKEEAIENAENIISFLEESKDELQERYERLEEQLNNLTEEKQESQTELEEVRSKLDELEIEHQSKVQELNVTLEEQSARLEDQERQLNDMWVARQGFDQKLRRPTQNKNHIEKTNHFSSPDFKNRRSMHPHQRPAHSPLSAAASACLPDLASTDLKEDVLEKNQDVLLRETGVPSVVGIGNRRIDPNTGEEIECDPSTAAIQQQAPMSPLGAESDFMEANEGAPSTATGNDTSVDGTRSLRSAPWAHQTPSIFPRTFPTNLATAPSTTNRSAQNGAGANLIIRDGGGYNDNPAAVDRVISNINTDDISDVDSDARGPTMPTIFNCGESTFHEGSTSAAPSWIAPFFTPQAASVPLSHEKAGMANARNPRLRLGGHQNRTQNNQDSENIYTSYSDVSFGPKPFPRGGEV